MPFSNEPQANKAMKKLSSSLDFGLFFPEHTGSVAQCNASRQIGIRLLFYPPAGQMILTVESRCGVKSTFTSPLVVLLYSTCVESYRYSVHCTVPDRYSPVVTPSYGERWSKVSAVHCCTVRKW